MGNGALFDAGGIFGGALSSDSGAGADITNLLADVPDAKNFPGIAVSLAQTPGMNQGTAQAIVGAASAKSQIGWASQQSKDLQLMWWKSLTDEGRQAAQQAGYAPPQEDGPIHQVAGTILGGIGHGISSVVHGVGNVVGGTLDTLQAGMRGMQHIERTGQRMDELTSSTGEAQGPIPLLNNLPGYFDPHTWAKAWSDTGKGEETFDARRYREASAKYSDDPLLFQLAEGIAKIDPYAEKHKDPGQIAAELVKPVSEGGIGADPAKVGELLKSPRLNDAVRDLSAAKRSFGRDMDATLGITPDAPLGLYSITSGVLDGAADWFGDPTLVAGKIGKAYQVSKYGLRAANQEEFAARLAQVAQLDTVKTYFEGGKAILGKPSQGLLHHLDVVRNGEDTARTASWVALNRDYKDSKGLWSAMLADKSADGLKTTSDLQRYLVDNHAVSEILKGSHGTGVPLMAHRNAAGLWWAQVKPSSIVDFSDTRAMAKLARLRAREDILLPPEMAGALDKADAALKTSTEALSSARSNLATAGSEGLATSADDLERAMQAKEAGQATFDQASARAEQFKNNVDTLVSGKGDLVGAMQDAEAVAAYGERFRTLREEGGPIKALRDVLGRQRSEREGSFYQRFSLMAGRFDAKAFRASEHDLTDPKTTDVIYNAARSFLGKTQAEQIGSAFQAADIAGKKVIWRGTLASLGRAAGLKGDDLVKWDESLHPASGLEQFYSANGAAFSSLEGAEQGWMAKHMTATVNSPDFANLYKMASRRGILDRAAGASQASWIDGYTNNIWRPLVLLRPAMALRNGLEEVVAHTMRYNLSDYVGGRVVRGQVIDAAREAAIARGEQGLADDLAGVTWRTTTRALRWGKAAATAPIKWGAENIPYVDPSDITTATEAAAHGIRTPVDWALSHFLSPMRQRLISKYIDPQSLDDLKHAFSAENSDLLKMFVESIRETSTKSFRELDSASQRAAIKASGKSFNLVDIKNGRFGKFSADDEMGASRWASMLDELDHDQVGKIALAHLDADGTRAQQAIREWVESDAGAWYRKNSRAYKEGGAARVAHIAHTDTMDRIFRDGQWHDDVAARILARGEDGTYRINPTLNPEALMEIPSELRPASLVGREKLLVPATEEGTWAKIMDQGFGWIGEMSSYISREPIFFANMARATRNLRPYEDMLAAKLAGDGEEITPAIRTLARARMYEVAHSHATEETLGYVDNAEQRSQLASINRNIMPFYRAQEESLRRWAKVAKFSPESFEKAQLTHAGFQHSGAIQTDDQGNGYFLYPGAPEAIVGFNNFLLDLSKTAGFNLPLVSSPVPFSLRGEVKLLSPMTDAQQSLVPSLGPVAAVPLSLAAHMFPEVASLEKGLVGEEFAGQNPITGLMPSFVKRMANAMGYFDNGAHINSAMQQSYQALKAAGQTPPPNAPPEVQQAFMDNLRHTTMTTLGLRAITALFAPTPMSVGPSGGQFETGKLPEFWQQFGEFTLHDEFRSYLKGGMSLDQAYVAWLAGRGKAVGKDALGQDITLGDNLIGYTVSGTKTTSPSGFQSTDATAKFMADHKDLFKAFPKAGAFFIPQAEGVFDNAEYNRELSMGLRQKKDFAEFARDVQLAGPLRIYYARKDATDAKIAAARASGDAETVRTLTDQFSTWKGMFQALNPALVQHFAEGASRATDRRAIVQEMGRALDSGLVPDTHQAALFRDLLTSYAQYEFQHSQLGATGIPGARQAQADMKAHFLDYLKTMSAKDPQVRMFIERVLRMD